MKRSLSAIITLIAAGGLLVTSCGSNATAAAATASTTSAAASAKSSGRGAFRSCLAEHGVELPQRSTTTGGAATPGAAGGADASGGYPAGGFGGGGFTNGQPPPGVDASTWTAAQRACGSLRSTGNRVRSGAGAAAYSAYRSCMADHGVTLPERPNRSTGAASTSTTASTTASTPTPPVTVDRTSPAYIAADQICRPLIAAAGGPSGSSSSTPTTAQQ